MSRILAGLESVVRNADEFSDAVRARLRRHTRNGRPCLIMPYLGFGTARAFTISGRVLRDPGWRLAAKEDSGWQNLVETFKRLESDEIPGARVRCRFQDEEHEVIADGEGYFQCAFAPSAALGNTPWQEVQLLLPAPVTQVVRAKGQVLIPPASARFGVISDIDDTVLHSDVAHKIRMLLLMVLSNAHTRKPFPGVAAFYNALQRGLSEEGNPLFYVSSSPWNLFTPLLEFLDLQHIPRGPLLLKDFGDHTLFSHDHHGHKLACIDRILSVYPELPFVLIGDSGEQDPEIYKEVVIRHPGRIKVIYIRNVLPTVERRAAIQALIAELRLHKTQLILAPDSEFAAAHAAAEGLISADAWNEVGRAARLDEAAAR